METAEVGGFSIDIRRRKIRHPVFYRNTALEHIENCIGKRTLTTEVTEVTEGCCFVSVFSIPSVVS